MQITNVRFLHALTFEGHQPLSTPPDEATTALTKLDDVPVVEVKLRNEQIFYVPLAQIAFFQRAPKQPIKKASDGSVGSVGVRPDPMAGFGGKLE